MKTKRDKNKNGIIETKRQKGKDQKTERDNIVSFRLNLFFFLPERDKNEKRQKPNDTKETKTKRQK